MAFSVNTNASAFVALQNLNKTNQDLATTQERINTGLKVGSAKDNAAVYAIAQNLRGDIAGLNAVKGSLDRAISTLDIALAAGEAVSDLLTELKEKAVSAKDSGLDTASRDALNDEFTELRDQITSIVENAEFNGKNLVESGATDVTAITDASGNNTITISAQDLTLGGAIITLSASQEISSAAVASTAVQTISTSASNLDSALSSLGAGATRLEIQRDFVGKLSDTIEVGIGNLVDADLAKESATLQALQVKQQLGLEALSIANQSPGAVLSLFN
ncbi:MAG: flagellin [Alphaproteobacteria bacterium]|nr:flagellin [Alphaproteobacteria bacterium]